jgi:Calpain family cysteine protease
MSVQTTFRPCLESLEQRMVPSGMQAYVAQGNLYVLGTSGSDFIQVAQTNQQLSVLGTQITLNGSRVSSVAASSIGQVMVYGNDGNDFIDLSTVKNNATIYEGNGDDYIRCGTGNETVNTGTGFDQIFRPYNPATPIINGATASDIRQGQNPLCQTDAALADLAQQGYNFSKDIQYLGSNTYQVNLHGLPAQKVVFNGWTNNNDPVEPNSGEFWTVLMQRARLQALGIDPTKHYTQSQWDAMNAKTNGQLYSAAAAINAFTGNPAYYTPIAYAGTPQTLQTALAQGDVVIAQSPASGFYTSVNGIIVNHAYAVTAVYYQNGVWKVRLYNPWGMDGINGTTIDALDTSNPPANDGFITLSWQQFTASANFVGFFVAKA